MGFGMMCATTLKTWVAQGGANYLKSGALPPPPPTGEVGGGGALHLHGDVVAQDVTADLVPIPRIWERGAYAERAYSLTHTGGATEVHSKVLPGCPGQTLSGYGNTSAPGPALQRASDRDLARHHPVRCSGSEGSGANTIFQTCDIAFSLKGET